LQHGIEGVKTNKMRKMQKPIDDAGQVFRTCISRVRDENLKSRLEAIETDVVLAAVDFEAAASVARLDTIPTHNNVGGVTKNEMTYVYTERMAKKGTPGRPVYDKLLAAPAYGRCPLCGLRDVSTLDHHLPKDHYPALSVVPRNLVPACPSCNKAKTNAIPHSEDDQTLHPYYDDVENDRWLYAEVIQVSPVALSYFVDPPRDWDAHLAKRVKHHFNVFKLATLYGTHAAETLVSIRGHLGQIYDEDGRGGVKLHLQRQADSYAAVHINSWQTAMYNALGSSTWYCDGGFRQ